MESRFWGRSLPAINKISCTFVVQVLLMKYILPLILLSVLIWSGCCKQCKSEFISDLPLQQSTISWFSNYTDDIDQQLVQFNRDDGYPAGFFYSAAIYGAEEFDGNCVGDDRCGYCCDRYGGRNATFELTSVDPVPAASFKFAFTKNFKDYERIVRPEEVYDRLSLSFNNKLSCQMLFDSLGLTGEFAYHADFEINDVTFNQVYVCTLSQTQVDPNKREPEAVYLTQNKGIVGFKFTNGEVWNLAP